jgi:cysteine synthase B
LISYVIAWSKDFAEVVETLRILELIGETPLIRLDRIAAEAPGVTILAKAEFCNPSGSVKDRAAKALVLDGLERGLLRDGKMLIDATSGNTGIAYAMLGAVLNLPVKLYMPQNTSRERKRMILSYGAEIVETDQLEGSDGAYLAVKAAYEADPERYYYPNQYNNPLNPQTHYESTGAEIWEQTVGRVTHFTSGMGTSGTFMGVARRLRTYGVQMVAVQPDSPFHGIEGTKHMASTIKPGFYDESMIDAVNQITTEAAYAMTRRLCREEGLFVGVSAGANVASALALAKTLPPGGLVVTILCDSGMRYLSESFWEA